MALLDCFGIPLLEMARIGGEAGYDFRIYSEPLGNPSFHILGQDFEIVVTIKDLKILESDCQLKRIEKSKYKFKKGDSLSGVMLRIVLSFMDKKVPHSELTRKQYLILLWNDNNPGFTIEPSFVEW